MADKINVLGFFLQDKPARVILELSKKDRSYPADIAKELMATYSHIVRVMQQLEAFGLVSSEKQGRTKYIKLTDLGRDVAHHLEGLERSLSRVGESTEKKKGKKLTEGASEGNKKASEK